MSTAVRPWVSSGVALIGASVIAVTPVAPLPRAQLPEIHVPAVHLTMPEVQLTASIADIFTFPAFRQYIPNRIDDVVTLGVGLAGSGAGLGASIAQLPGTVVTVTQQILTGQFETALTTIENYLIDWGTAIIEPTLTAIIERRERALAVQTALQTAVPRRSSDWARDSLTPLTASRGRPFKAARPIPPKRGRRTLTVQADDGQTEHVVAHIPRRQG